MEGDPEKPGNDVVELRTLFELIPGRAWYDPKKHTFILCAPGLSPDEAGLDIPPGEKLVEIGLEAPDEINSAAANAIVLNGLAQQRALPPGAEQS